MNRPSCCRRSAFYLRVWKCGCLVAHTHLVHLVAQLCSVLVCRRASSARVSSTILRATLCLFCLLPQPPAHIKSRNIEHTQNPNRRYPKCPRNTLFAHFAAARPRLLCDTLGVHSSIDNTFSWHATNRPGKFNGCLIHFHHAWTCACSCSLDVCGHAWKRTHTKCCPCMGACVCVLASWRWRAKISLTFPEEKQKQCDTYTRTRE